MKEYLIIISWILAIYLSATAFKRSEIYRAKDKIVDRLDKLQEWLVKEIKSLDADSDNKKSFTVIENYSASKITQVELRLNQFNSYISKNILNPEDLAEIRDIDFFSDIDESILLKEINNRFSNVIEKIEFNFDNYTKDSISHQLSTYRNEFVSATSVLVFVYVLFLILDLLY